MPARRWLRLLPAVTGAVSAVSAAVFVVALALVFWFFVRSVMLGGGTAARVRSDRLVDRWTAVALWSLVVGAGSLVVSLCAGAAGRLVDLVAARRAARPPAPPSGPASGPPPG